MNSALARLLTRLYPHAWRERYGEEFEALLLDGRGSLGTAADVIWWALGERISPTQGGSMNPNPNSFGAIVRHPSAYLPMVMSLAALAMVLGHIALYGLAPEAVVNGRPDEGAVAHIWQLLMAGQLPILAYFAIRWLPRATKPALGVLALQAGAVLASMAPVLFLNL